MNYEYKKWIPQFNLRSTDLPFLSAEAAIDMDNYQRGVGQEEESIQHLSYLLTEVTKGEKPRLLYPDYQDVLFNAIPGRENVDKYWKGKTQENLLEETKEIARNLGNFKELGADEQEELGDFCVRLSRELALHQETYYSRRSGLVA